VLDDGTAVMSERGTADLLGMDQKTLGAVRGNWPPKALKPFIEKDFIVATNSVKVIAENSPHKGREITVYTAETVETLIFAYAMALAHRALRENQRHIGERCVILMRSLVRAALEAAIKEACGLPLHIQKTVQQHFIDAVKLTRDLGLKCSVGDDIVTKKDLIEFLGITMGKLNGHLRKHRKDIDSISLNRQQIRAIGSNASRLNGYPVDHAVKIILGMDSVPGIQLKEQLFGSIGIFAKPHTAQEIQWEAKLAETFEGFDFHHNYPIGPYRVDFFIGESKIVLECNGYEHRYYDEKRESEREGFITQEYSLIRFDHHVRLEKLINAILQIKPGEVIRLRC
jgi:very-short-patch-repair endonuclease